MARALQQIGDKYEVIRLLGEGGMGAVYLVRHRLLEELRVVKIMHSQLEEDSDQKTRFLREAKAAVQLKHPNIAHVHDFWIDESGDAFLVMEYIEGLNLVELLKRHGLPEQDLSLSIGRQSLRALGYLHSKQFVHRDVSPDNLMLTRDVDDRPLIKLIDLGIAKDINADANLTRAGSFIGKMHYASPEQFEPPKDGAEIDGRSDLYSFGIVLYLLLTGKYPIQGEKGSALIAGHLLMPPMSFEDSDPQGRVPERLRSVLIKSLEKDPADRFASAEEFMDALDASLGGRAQGLDSIPTPVIDDLNRSQATRVELGAGPTRQLDDRRSSEDLDRFGSEITELIAADRLDEATSRIHEIFGNEPTDSTATSLLQTIAERRCDQEAQERALRLQEEAKTLYEDGRLQEAIERTEEALSLHRHGATEELHRTLLREIERNERAQTMARRLDLLAEEGKLEDLGPLLREAEREFGAGLFTDQRQAHDDAQLARARQSLDQARELFEAGELDRAERILDGVPQELEAASVQASRQRLGELRESERRKHALAERLDALAAEIESHLESADLETARKLSIEGLGLDPEHARLLSLERQIQRREQEIESARELEASRHHLLEMLDGGYLDKADAAIDSLVQAGGRTDEIAFFRERLEKARRRQESDRLLTKARSALDRDDLETAALELQAAEQRDPGNEGVEAVARLLESLSRARRIELDQEELTEVAVSAALDAVRSASGTSQKIVTPPVGDRATRGGSPKSERNRLIGIAAVVALVAMGSLWLFSRGQGTDEPLPAAPTQGRLEIDAIPWGQIVSIEDEREVIQELPADPQTPLAIELDSGIYEIVVDHLGEQRRLTARVVGGETRREVAQFSTVDSDDYFERVRPRGD